METVLMIGSICSAVMALITLTTLILKKPKKWIRNWIEKITKEELDGQLTIINEKLNQLVEQMKKNEENERVKLGHSIMTIYDRSINRGYITLADKKDLVELYPIYKRNHGNHHVDNYYKILLDMDVVNEETKNKNRSRD